MKIAIYGNEIEDHYIPVYKEIFDFFKDRSSKIILAHKVHEILQREYNFQLAHVSTFCKEDRQSLEADILLSIGGDGTFLNSVSYALHKQIPIAGINCGRLGFMADVSSDDLKSALLHNISSRRRVYNPCLIAFHRNVFRSFWRCKRHSCSGPGAFHRGQFQPFHIR